MNLLILLPRNATFGQEIYAKPCKNTTFLSIVVLFFVFSCGCRNNQDISSQIEVTSDELIGIWKLDSVTKYTFDGRGNGKMAVSDSEYEFNYTINNDEIKIDFEFGENKISTVFVYEKKDKYFIEQPYNGIYKISPDEYNSIEKYIRESN